MPVLCFCNRAGVGACLNRKQDFVEYVFVRFGPGVCSCLLAWQQATLLLRWTGVYAEGIPHIVISERGITRGC